ncbi:MAG: hypothetical protein H8E71_00230 [Candidatus Marinimicrobia bacterium]|nr:hypothetical protein [Candidatus Neomarinimicrobiota bacterium]
MAYSNILIPVFFFQEIDSANQEEQDEANWIINRLVEADSFPLPKDFLEYWQQQLSPYDGMMGKIVKKVQISLV